MKNKIIIACTIVFSSTLAIAGTPATPIDGGLSILLLLGSAFGVKKIVDARKNK